MPKRTEIKTPPPNKKDSLKPRKRHKPKQHNNNEKPRKKEKYIKQKKK